MLEGNLKRIRERVEKTALKVGRDPEDIEIVVVSKGVSPELIKRAFELGIENIGENIRRLNSFLWE